MRQFISIWKNFDKIVKSMKRKFCILFISLWIIAFCIVGCTAHVRYLSKGRQYAAAGDWDKSSRFFQMAHEEHPDDPEIKLMLARSRWEASMFHMSKGEVLLNKNRFNEAIKELQTSITFNPANQKAGKLIETARKKREAIFYLNQGQDLIKLQKYHQALEVFQKAVKLDPNNKKAREALELFEKKKDKRPPKFVLKSKSESPISLKFKNSPVFNVFEVLSKLSGINFIFDKDVKESSVTLFMTDVSFDRFIEVLLRTNDLAAKVIDEKTIIVYPNTPAKAKIYEDLQIRTFHLAHMDAKKAAGLISKILKARNIVANEKLNTIVIRGSKDVIQIASKVIDANDCAPAEVILNVEILEVSRNKEKKLGLEYPESLTLGIGESQTDISKESSFNDVSSIYALGNISSKELMLSKLTATLYLLKQDAETRTLAKPQIRVKNGEKSSIHIGERIPLRVNRRVDSSTGDVTSDFQYFDIGIKLETEPVINVYGEITLKLNIEVSALGPNLSTLDDPQYAIKTRKAKTVLSLRDDEAVIIGGLISDEEKETVRKVPYLGEIPVLGRLFSSLNNEGNKKDVLMVITPILIKDQEIPGAGVMKFWSGKEKDFSLREPYESYVNRKNLYLDRPKKEYIIKDKKDSKGEKNILEKKENKDMSQTDSTSSKEFEEER